MSVSVTFVGAGDAFNAAGRCHACYFVRAPSTSFLLDCGPTVLLGLQQAGLKTNDVDAVFVSHLHGDHFAGLPFLFLAWLYESPRDRPVTIVGPPGTEQRVEELYRAMYRDLAGRPMPFEVRFVEVEPGKRRTFGPIELLPFRVPHQETDVSLGFRVAVDGSTITYSGDTGWTEELVVQSQGADLFICECCFYETRVDFHLDYPRLLENHHRFGCRRLVLTHIGREVHAHRADLTLEIAHDGMTVDL
jgi:ribonuclease BN (tRNA processing enzyme)